MEWICQNGRMGPQLSQDYRVDGRYTGGKRSIDNTAGEAFLRRFLARKQISPDLSEDRLTEDRFIMRGPGDSGYTFKNAFRASK